MKTPPAPMPVRHPEPHRPQPDPARTSRRPHEPARALLALALVLSLTLSACGPKDIGQGSSSDMDYSDLPMSTAEQMRYPVTGSSRHQQMLYYYNRPHIMQQVQEWRLQQFNRAHGTELSPEDPAYRAKPAQRSPFRQ